MKIVEIREKTVPISSPIRNAYIDFSKMTLSVVAVITDVVRNGKPVTGIAFDSIGRYAQGGLLRERFFPRLLAARPESLLDESGRRFDPAKVHACAMRNEKPGGHGDRAAAVAALELAFWDLNAKLDDEPAFQTISRAHGVSRVRDDVDVYAAGGYYYPGDPCAILRDELQRYRDMGFSAFKMKIGGADLATDVARVEAALEVAGDGSRLAVDANGRFSVDEAAAYAKAMAPFGLRWFEEACDPLDFDANRRFIEGYPGAVATGENLFSAADVRNLLRFGGMRADRDIFQMDAGLSYGLTEYGRILAEMDAHGYRRAQLYPHGGHLINLHIAVGLELGGCEAYPGVFQPFGGYCDECVAGDGRIAPSGAPGFGLERKPELREAIGQLLA